MHRSSSGPHIRRVPNVGNQGLNSLSPILQQYILQPLLLGSVHPAHSPPRWSSSQSSSPAAFHIVHISQALLCPAVGIPAASRPLSVPCFLLRQAQGSGCQSFLWEPQIFMNDYPGTSPHLLSWVWFPGTGRWRGTLGLAHLPWNCQVPDASVG